MRILFVAMPHSIHVARWINQIADQGWDIHLFPSGGLEGIHPALRNLSIHSLFYGHPEDTPSGVKVYGVPLFSNTGVLTANHFVDKVWPNLQAQRLKSLVQRLKPDIIHSLEFQGSGYLTLKVKNQYKGTFPTWIATNWGSDIYLFGRLAAHVEKIRGVLQNCNYYSCECQRDVGLAQDMGLHGKVLPVLPNGGGFDLDHCDTLRQPGKTSERKLILLKGYQSFAGRALVGLRAIALCANELKGYRVAVYVANPDVAIAAELLSRSSGVPIDVIPYCSHDEILRYYGQARIYIGLSISDAISTSLLESMVMGAFPIQSCTACADEWIQDGRSGFIVPPEDPEIVAAAIRRALQEDKLVDEAAVINAETARERLEQTKIKQEIIRIYNSIITNQQEIYGHRL